VQRMRLRHFATFPYVDPKQFLIELRKLELDVAIPLIPARVRTLRAQGLKPAREMRDAAIFCVGMADRTGFDMSFASVEGQDFDFVTRWVDEEKRQNYCPVQLKEVPPPHLNEGITIQKVVDGLARYTDSADLAVAIKINRPSHFSPDAIKLPGNLRINSLWAFGSVSIDQSEFGLWGDFLSRDCAPFGTKFTYPQG